MISGKGQSAAIHGTLHNPEKKIIAIRQQWLLTVSSVASPSSSEVRYQDLKFLAYTRLAIILTPSSEDKSTRPAEFKLHWANGPSTYTYNIVSKRDFCLVSFCVNITAQPLVDSVTRLKLTGILASYDLTGIKDALPQINVYKTIPNQYRT